MKSNIHNTICNKKVSAIIEERLDAPMHLWRATTRTIKIAIRNLVRFNI
jgi:hypothetical protein